jgi:hypothetical protein
MGLPRSVKLSLFQKKKKKTEPVLDHITSDSANFETVLSLLSSFFVPEDEDAFMFWISDMLGNKKVRQNMARWRRDWQALVAAGKEGDALL